MGWKGATRSFGAAMRAAERDAQRRRRQAEREHRAQVQHVERLMAADEVAEFEEHVEAITSVHRDWTLDLIDWRAIADAEPPLVPKKSSKHEDRAVSEFTSYAPSLLDRLLFRAKGTEDALERAIPVAREQDERDYRAALAAHHEALKTMESERALARRLLAGDLGAFEEVLRQQAPFSGISALGSSVEFQILRNTEDPPSADSVTVIASIHVHGEGVIPKQRKALLKSGKLTVKEMPKGEYYALHQDYVCGCVLRVANEALALLPVPGVIVTAMDRLLNPATGHVEEQPILSVYAPRRTMEGLNLPAVDPSDAMANFLHRMSFKKTQGFAPVKAITREDVPGPGPSPPTADLRAAPR